MTEDNEIVNRQPLGYRITGPGPVPEDGSAGPNQFVITAVLSEVLMPDGRTVVQPVVDLVPPSAGPDERGAYSLVAPTAVDLMQDVANMAQLAIERWRETQQ